MTNYTKATNFAAKDSLASGNAAKVVKGTEIDTEFTNIETAVNSKSDSANPVFTGVAEFADGSASAPSITNTADTNTGMFFPAADTIAFAEGGTEAMRLDSSGNMGLGVTPSSWSSSGNLQIKGSGLDGGIASANQYLVIGANGYYNAGWKYITTGNATLYQQSTGQHQWYTAASGTAGNSISFTQAMTLDASGNLGIGTSSPAKKLDIASGDIRLSSGYTVQWGGTNNYIYADSSSNFFTVITASSERMRIDSSGNVLVGTTNSSNTAGTGLKFSANGLAASVLANSGTASDTWNVYNTTAGAFRFYVTNGGTIFATSTTISAISDERLKENVRDLEFGLSEVMALKPRRFDWKEGKGQDKKNAAGFIAQEFETVFPDSVGLSKAGEDGVEYKNINHEELIPTLVKAIQEQQAIIAALTARIEALEA